MKKYFSRNLTQAWMYGRVEKVAPDPVAGAAEFHGTLHDPGVLARRAPAKGSGHSAYRSATQSDECGVYGDLTIGGTIRRARYARLIGRTLR